MSCTDLKEVTIPHSVNSIGGYAFNNCSSLLDITIPNSVKRIGEHAFWATSWLNSQPDGLIYINDILYKYKGELPANTPIEIKEGTVAISPAAFSSCSALEEVTIPHSVTSIGRSAFYNCTGIQKIYCRAQYPPIPEEHIFAESVQQNAILYIPPGCKEAYQEAAQWKDFANIIQLITLGMDEVADSEVTVTTHNGVIVVTGVDSLVSIEVYSVGGRLIYQGADTTISVEPGIYLVRVGNEIVKIVV